MALPTIRSKAFPYRRGSNASENDFFDIDDEPIVALVKRQFRRIRTWVILALFVLFIMWRHREKPPSSLLPHIHYDEIDWSRYAYTTYATSETYLCNAVMVFEALQRFGSRAERASQASWDTSTAKLSAFGAVEYERVIHLDSDITLLQHMDELFFLPPTTIAMPRAYWLLPHTKTLSSLLAVIQPSYREYTALTDYLKPVQAGQIEVNLTDIRYDMELLNDRTYLGNDHEAWNPDLALAEAKFVHFSDWPLPKPWIMWPQEILAKVQPACDKDPGTPNESGCRDRELWRKLYDDFRRQRKDICKLLSYPAPV
ncbi:uncharacterized protein N7477_001170 [Penicillium maclennaniae]|uniref:uncharacterized protein n=1 Tax=Penicillium maclennaniae TaxID=1343394 RepID=UPI002540C6F8|nr:uncharacterized protein N7477_001170 [Penicillium maclennaniae]KAJ5684825.1 hypothetical protein N7477_001170 [Penicillium maclennaniae]